ncbi:phosphoglycerol transferase family protein, alkaline phosphatase superfamily [Desulfosporosinus acidiphilus SJ4]|uniref:Phosphoglycerol transferase family protein, alkaline phosphatase superfamily n=2 Tax=Desulfosporosinus TaxID=79206 RepID=I4D689_DESAJ|nr:phosphoglycerol transferase family protein, alkaline phosphatase superfamily [Desulfosporosinus acidiphilus SJ4]
MQFVKNNIILVFMVLSILAKFILFLGLVNNDNSSKFNFMKAFYSFSSPPPLIVYISMILIPLSFSFLFRGHLRFWFMMLCNILMTSLVLADLMYYRGFNSFISPYILSQTTNLDNLSSSIISMLRPIDVLMFADLLVYAALWFFRKSFFQQTPRYRIAFLLTFLLPITCIYYEHLQLDLSGNPNTMLFRVSWSPNQTMSNLSPLGYHIFDLYNFYKNKHVQPITPQQTAEIQNWFEQKQENMPTNHFTGMFAGQNLLVIQVESLENFVINQKINGQEITPNLNKLLANSLYFSNFYEQVNNGTSSDADLMTNTSVYPIRTGATFFRFPDNTYNSLPKMLAQKGYSTLAIHPDKGAYWNWMPALRAIGFEKTYDVTHFDETEKIGLGISDGSYLKQIPPIIEKEKLPFYNFIVTLTSHNPFDLPAQYRTLKLSDELNQSKLGGYFQSIHYTDEQIGHFLDTLDQSGVLNNTVVVIYGDHTGVHKYYDDEVKQVQPQQSWWLDDSKRIPLIIFHKGMKGEELKITGGQIDTMPTIASLMGINEKLYANTAFGRNLLNTKKNFAVLANKQYIGQAPTKDDEDQAIMGIDMADLVIEKNYFKTQGYK